MKLFEGIRTEKLFKAINFTPVCMAIHGEEKAVEMCKQDRFDYKTEFVNWGGAAGFVFFGYLISKLLNGALLLPEDFLFAIESGLISGGGMFFGRFMIKRHLIKKEIKIKIE